MGTKTKNKPATRGAELCCAKFAKASLPLLHNIILDVTFCMQDASCKREKGWGRMDGWVKDTPGTQQLR